MTVDELGWVGIVAAVCACAGSSSGSADIGKNAAALSITVSGEGSVKSPDGTVSCTSICSAQLTLGTAVHLDATPAAGMLFAGWSGACTGTGSCELALDSDMHVGAAFSDGSVTLTVNPVGSGEGLVTSSPAGIHCPGACAIQVAPGTPMTLTATAGAGSRFEGFGGSGCSGLTCAFTVSAAVTVFANFSSLAVGPACAGLLPALPAAGTFTAPAGGPAGDICGTATSDALGNLYVADGTLVASSAGAAVTGGVALLVPLRSGFATIGAGTAPERTFIAHAPDGTQVSQFGVVLTGPVGEQANGGTILATVACDPTGKIADFVFRRIDDRNGSAVDRRLPDQPCVPETVPSAILVDPLDRTLMVYLAGDALPPHLAARWFDNQGQPLTGWFDAGPSTGPNLRLRPLIGGGAALRAGQDWVATFPSGRAEVGPAPAGFEAGKDARIVLGGTAYAMVPDPGRAGTIDIVDPHGTSCGSLATANGGDRFFVGKDGSLIDLTGPSPGPGGPGNRCTATEYPQALE